MSSVCIYLDESGDLGWTFDRRYRQGGSSRHLTIAALVVPDGKRHLPKRVIKRLYEKCEWDPKEEMKWSLMPDEYRIRFAGLAKNLATNHNDIRYFSISVKKQNVQEHIRRDPNKLYNYMIRLLLIDEMAKHEEISLVPDPRSIKVESGNSLHDYLQTILWFDKQVTTILKTTPQESHANRNVQFADMLSGLVQAHIEWNRSPAWNLLAPVVRCKWLFFDQQSASIAQS